jgi:hypothetical protein
LVEFVNNRVALYVLGVRVLVLTVNVIVVGVVPTEPDNGAEGVSQLGTPVIA